MSKQPIPPLSKPNKQSYILHKVVESITAWIPLIVQGIYRFNQWVAGKLHLPDWISKRLLGLEIIGFLGAGLQMIQVEEYAAAVMFWLIVCLIWVSKAVSWRSLPERNFARRALKLFHVVVALTSCAALITWTSIKRDDRPWTAFQKLHMRPQQASSRPTVIPTPRVALPMNSSPTPTPRGMTREEVFGFPPQTHPGGNPRPTKPHLYAADIGPVISNPGMFWAVSNGGSVVSPIDALIGLRIVNLQSTPASLTSVTLDIKDSKGGWMRLRRIPLENVNIFSGPLNSAGRVRFEPGNIRASLVNSDIEPGRTIRGIGIYEYSNPAYRTSEKERSHYRITITDTAHRRDVIETADKPPSNDPYSATEEQDMIGGEEPPQDLRTLPLRRYLPPVKEYVRK